MHVESTLTGCAKFAGIKTILLNTRPDATFHPQQLERTMLLVLLPLFAVACFASAANDILNGIATWFERYQLIPTGMVFLAIWYWCAHTRSANVGRIRLATLILGPGIVFERFVLGLWLMFTEDFHASQLGSMTVWMILSACLYVFLIPGRGAFLAGLVYYGASAVLILLFLAFNTRSLPDALTQEYLTAYIIATPIFLAMIAGFSRLRVAYSTALDRVADFQHLAMQDSLTGLFNRRAFGASMRRARSRMARRQTPVSMVMIDLDHFKSINDTYGHDKGDTVLARVARILTDTMRRTDDVFRWGGEEFVILMEETAADEAGLVADRLRALIEQAEMIKGRTVTASFGVAQLLPGEDDTEFFHRADAALYDAKDMGRNRVVVRKRPKRPSDPKVMAIANIIDPPKF
jgi:diguanylate cyclase (GGDEF)-like protein